MDEIPRSLSTSKAETKSLVESLLKSLEETRLETEAMRTSLWQRLMGNRLEQMLVSPAATLPYVADPDPNLRRGALALLTDRWPPDAAMEEVCRRVIASDPNWDVRAAAVSCLARLGRATHRKDLSGVVAEIVRDDSVPGNLRGVAYLGLLEIQGREPARGLSFALIHNADWLKEVDWEMVDSFLGVRK